MAFFLLVFLLLFAQTLPAQTPGISGVNVVIKRVSLPEDAQSRIATTITQDRRGFIWMGTQKGLSRYDGNTTIVYSLYNAKGLLDDFVWTICEDHEGFLWVGTRHGLSRFDPITQTFKPYLHDSLDPSSLSNDSVRAILEDRVGDLWVGTAHGLNMLNRKAGTWTRYYTNADDTAPPGDNFINTILEDRKGNLWIGSGDNPLQGGGVFTFDRNAGRFTSVGPRLRVITMFEDGSGELWVSIAGPQLFTINRETAKFTQIGLPKRDPGAPDVQGIKSVCEDKSGALWMATWGWGLLRYDKKTRIFTRYFSDPSYPKSAVNKVFTDRAGLVWVAAAQGGIHTVSTKSILPVHRLGNFLRLEGSVSCLFADRAGVLWIGLEQNGLWRFDPTTQKATQVLPDAILGSDGIFQDEKGTLWIADRQAVTKYDSRRNRCVTVWRVPDWKKSPVRLRGLLVDHDKSLWLRSPNTIFQVARDLTSFKAFVHDPLNPQSLTAGHITSVAEDRQGNIWVSTEKGLNRFERESESFTRFLDHEDDSTSLGPGSWPRPYVDRSGTLWVSTNSGLNRYNEENATFTRFVSPDKRQQSVEKVQEDLKGKFWFFSGGISKFDPATSTFASYDLPDGIEDAQVRRVCITRLKSGEIVFGMMDGLLVFHPDSLMTCSFVPPIVITGIKKLNRQVRLGTSSELLREFSFEHGENMFSISYAALSYDMPEFNQYAYTLEGFDKDWAYVGNKREAMYTNLDPGEYIFRVKGSNHDGIWNETGASLKVTIRPAFWQTWWFKLSTVIALLGLFAFVYKREVTHLRKEKLIQQEFSRQQIESQEAERKRLAAELHDGLGQDLLVMNNELQQFMQENRESREELKQVASLVHESIEGVREISANLHPHHLERLGLRAAIEAMVEKVSRSSELNVQLIGDTIDRLLPKETEIHVYRIIQEALSNIVRHASAKNVTVQVKKNSESIEITVSDDGKGFNVNDALIRRPLRPSGEGLHGFGLSSMTERVRIVGGTMKIESSPGSGTTVHVSIPVPEGSG